MKTEATHWMLVDDNENILAVVAAVLKTLTDAEVECYHSPPNALAAFAAAPEKYGLVITDFEMPGMDGSALCRQMRAISSLPKFFLTTGSGYFTDDQARHVGFDALLHKPFAPADLKSALTENWLNGTKNPPDLTPA